MTGRHQPGSTPRQRTAEPAWAPLVVTDEHGRPRGLGIPADRQGTVVTAYETVAGLTAPVLRLPGGTTRRLGPEAVQALPDLGLALLHTAHLGGLPGAVPPITWSTDGCPVTVLHHATPDAEPTRLHGVVVGRCTAVQPTGAGGFRTVAGALLLRLPPSVPAPEPGAPVLDAATGAVLGLLAPTLRGDRPDTVAAAPLVPGLPPDVLLRNAECAPAFGPALNLGGVLRLTARQLDAATAGPGRITTLAADRVERPDGLTGEEPCHPVTVLTGTAGSGRSTELAALAVRRATGPRPLPTLWLRGADLRPADDGLADAVARALAAAADALGVPVPDPAAAARLCAAAGRPLLVLLDAPEEALAEPSAAWQAHTAHWLAEHRARLLLACRPESRAAALGPALLLGPLPAAAAVRVAHRLGADPALLAPADAAHPQALRAAGDLRAAGVTGRPGGRGELYAAHLDLRCLRIARRITTADDRRPGAHRRGAPPPARAESTARLRRTAVVVAGRVHEAARLLLGAGHGGLTAEEFERLFPTAGGWGPAVLAEGLFVRAGEGFRPSAEDPADWLQGRHLDLDQALRMLVDGGSPAAGVPAAREPRRQSADPKPADPRPAGAQPPQAPAAEATAVPPKDAEAEDAEPPGEPESAPRSTAPAAPEKPAAPAAPAAPDAPEPAGHGVPRHRLGPVAAALRQVAETRGAEAMDLWLNRLRLALEADRPGDESAWWAARLLAAVLPAVPVPAAHRPLLERLTRHPAFPPAWWAALRLAPADRMALLRLLVRTDPANGPYHAAVRERLTADPATVQPLLCAWFSDAAPLADGSGATVADLAHDLLFTHRSLALDELTEALVDVAHPRADALLARLAVDEPSALCRAVDRWSHDPRPERHVAAAVHALRTAPQADPAGAALLRFTALTLLAREDEPALHGAALALLLRDPASRSDHLPRALAAYAADDPFLGAAELAPALEDHPDEIVAAVGRRLEEPAAPFADGLRLLAGARDAATARRGVLLAARQLREHPERAGRLAAHLEVLLEAGHDAGPLVAEVVAAPATVRKVFAPVLAIASADPARDALLDALLDAERDPAVLAAVLERFADGCALSTPERAREVVRRLAEHWPDADAELVRAAGHAAAFARVLADWPDTAPPPPKGPLTERLRELAAEGRDPQYAAAEAERDAHGAADGPRESGRARA
ncbi:serine protease [Kitasatospora sp. NPDC059571]|uniref:serine protease n=1 Tax=Kitasatospora sp. NPDC059571 TaxID=3346871 RepID=UPI0036A863E7